MDSRHLPDGLYPATVTPFNDGGALDAPSVLRLMAYYEASGCQGVVLAGTNGEGPSLSNYEKRELLQVAHAGRGKLKLILGIATPSLTDAIWLAKQAAKHGADAILLMPPGYFRSATEEGIEAWFRSVLDSIETPTLLYNFPKMTGISLAGDLIARLMLHPNVIGLKDSSGERQNLTDYRNAIPPEKSLFVGDENLLVDALDAGWSGSISGAANAIPQWLSRVVGHHYAGENAERDQVFRLLEPVIQAIRELAQPETHKAFLHSMGILSSSHPRAPLLRAEDSRMGEILERTLGIRKGVPNLPDHVPAFR